MNRSPSDCCGNGSLEKWMQVVLVAWNKGTVLFLVMPPILSAFMKSRQYLMNDKCNDIGAGLSVADEGD